MTTRIFSRKKTLFIVAVLLIAIFALLIGGTAAWLTEYRAVENVFIGSDLQVNLTENHGQAYTIVPGDRLAKSPYVTVEAGSEPCYVFIKAVESNNLDDYVTYTVDTEVWTPYPDDTGEYYYITVGKVGDEPLTATTDKSYILQGTAETNAYNDDLTNGYVEFRLARQDGTALTNETLSGVEQTLSFKAFAIQQANLTLHKAFEIAKTNLG